MFHVRGRLCRNERTGFFTLCRGKVKRKRASKKRKPMYRARSHKRASRKRAPKRSTKRGCKVMALYMTPTGQRRWMCAQFGKGKKAGLKHSPNFVSGSEMSRGEYLKMQKNPGYGGGRYGSREPSVFDFRSPAERDAAGAAAAQFYPSEQPMESRGSSSPPARGFSPSWLGPMTQEAWDDTAMAPRAQMSLFPKG